MMGRLRVTLVVSQPNGTDGIGWMTCHKEKPFRIQNLNCSPFKCKYLKQQTIKSGVMRLLAILFLSLEAKMEVVLFHT